jgi:hypothetical protein
MALPCQAGRQLRCNRSSRARAVQQGRAGRVVVAAAAAAPAKPSTDLANLQFINPMWSQPKTEAVSSSGSSSWCDACRHIIQFDCLCACECQVAVVEF